ncbi:BQ2448_397 [Microbotryum intermedium]|uniref:BQ2448_397 protein n=1 Tax=Microbotryum intermedium TaxID=269621 RepID=A0A238FB20_9BASI|nr:BQ2448_397 [Microbotryum intermedium]
MLLVFRFLALTSLLGLLNYSHSDSTDASADSDSDLAVRKGAATASPSPGQVIEPATNTSLTVGKRFRYTYLPLYNTTQSISVTLVMQQSRAADYAFSNYTLTSHLSPDSSGAGGRLQSWFYLHERTLPSDEGTYSAFIETVEREFDKATSKSTKDGGLHASSVQVQLVR